MTVTTRFAPSPTGRLHVGTIRTALHNALFARASGGTFLLRIDDTDAARSSEDNVASIHADLAWLGLAPDATARQSERFDLYEREFAKLRGAGRVYACYETPEELDVRRKVHSGAGCPRSMSARTPRRRRPRESRPTGAFGSIMTRRSNGTIWYAGRRSSIPS